MGVIFEIIGEALYWLAVVVIAIITWIAVNFARAIVQAIHPHPEYLHRRIL